MKSQTDDMVTAKTLDNKWIYIPFTTIIVLWVASLLLIPIFFEKPNDSGSFGDMFGATNALFSGFAFAGIIITIYLQNKELKLQRVELELTREELRGQKEQLANQNLTMSRQRFENTFFQLLRNHRDIVNSMDIRRRAEIVSEGSDCFKTFYTEFQNKVGQTKDIGAVLQAYMEFYAKRQQDLGHYFRNLYHVVRFIDDSKDIEGEEKFVYSRLLRALLSSNELVLLFYNALSRFGNEKFKPLIEKYSLLKNMEETLLISMEHKKEYNKLAFAGSQERITWVNA